MRFKFRGKKVRDRQPKSPGANTPKSNRGRPGGKGPNVVVASAEAFRALRLHFPRLPDGLWNSLVSNFAASFKQMAKRLSQAFEDGIDQQLLPLLEHGIPQEVQKLGRGICEATLCENRGFCGSRLQDANGVELKYQGDRQRTILTPLGHINFRRSYYLGRERAGEAERAVACYPLDVWLGLDGEHGILPGLQEHMALLASRTSYPDALSILKSLLPVPKLCLRSIERVCTTIAQNAADFRESDLAKGTPPSCNVGEKTGVSFLCVDGGMVPVRDDDEKHKEVKMAVLGRLRRRLLKQRKSDNETEVYNKLYFAHLGRADPLFERLALEYFRQGFAQSKVLHVVADMAAWIWRRVPELLQEGQELSLLYDFYHAKERLTILTNLLFEAGSLQAKAELELLLTKLLADDRDEFFSHLSGYFELFQSQKLDAASEALTFFHNHRSMLRYSECQKLGYPIGSGMVEGAVKFVLKDRCCRSGMRWKRPGAEDILQLRCIYASGQWDFFVERRKSERRKTQMAQIARWQMSR